VIAHVDMDAFYVSIEMLRHPELRGKPVVVAHDGPRGVVTTASYEARKYGVHSALPMVTARRRCPDLIVLPVDMQLYRRGSNRVMETLRQFSDTVEVVGMDEAYVDLSGSPVPQSRAQEIKGRIKAATRLVCSIGLAPNKLMAKIASDLDKPDGLVVVPPGGELEVLHPLPVTRLGGVGPATAERLHQVGVKTVADLAAKSLPDLVALAGRAHGTGLYALARAEDDRPVVAEREAKSISQEETFARDLTDLRVLGRYVDSMAARVGSRLRASAYSGRTVTLKLRRYDFTTLTRSQTLPHPTDDPRVIASIAARLLAEAGTQGGLRLLGVGVSGLSLYAQGDLFATDDEPVDDDVAAPGAEVEEEPEPLTAEARWWPGQDVRHDEHGAGWVWGRGLGRVTVRFEGPLTPPGPVRTLTADDPALHPAEPPEWRVSAPAPSTP
jgi:DNA polymerase IV